MLATIAQPASAKSFDECFNEEAKCNNDCAKIKSDFNRKLCFNLCDATAKECYRDTKSGTAERPPKTVPGTKVQPKVTPGGAEQPRTESPVLRPKGGVQRY